MAGQVQSIRMSHRTSLFLACLIFSTSMLGFAGNADALTEPKKEPVIEGGPDTGLPGIQNTEPEDSGAGITMPMPDPLVKSPDDQMSNPDATVGNDKPVNVEVLRDISKAPEAVRKMREMIVEAAASGDIERLRDLMKTKDGPTQVSLGDQPDDPIQSLKEVSGDPEGREVLAILLDILSTGFVRMDAGTPDETYIWPYFAEKELDSLSPPEMVDLLRIVTAGDYADMKEFGGYNFYRIGISATGEWKFFVAGD